MQIDRTNDPVYIRIIALLYLVTFVYSIYILYVSRVDEIYSVWGAVPITFLLAFFAATFLLLIMFLSSARTYLKLLSLIPHSILSRSLMVIMFPVGNVGVQQAVLGRTRLIFDNVIYHGLGWAREGLLLQIYVSLRGENLQAAMSVIFARMFGVDVYWTHLLLVPVLWGVFVPLISYKIATTLGLNENISVFSGLAISLFPTAIIWGYVSIPNGLGYFFFFCFVYSILRYIKSRERKNLYLVTAFLVVTFLSHYLTGVIAFSLFLLAYTVIYCSENENLSPMGAHLTMLSSFVFAVGLLPFALIYRRFFYPTAATYFSLQKFIELENAEKILALFTGNYFDLVSREAYITAIIFGLAPLLGLVGMVYILWSSKRNERSDKKIDANITFFLMGLLLIIIDDRIMRLFMVGVPFVEATRLWMIRDFLLFPFAGISIWWVINRMRFLSNGLSAEITSFLRRITSTHVFSKTFSFLKNPHLIKNLSAISIFVYLAPLILVSGWITASLYYSYPHFAPLQTTFYEVEAVKYIDQTANGSYVVVADQWIIFAGQMFVGINNPRAFYFSHVDPRGVILYTKMKRNPSNTTLIEAMKINNAETAFFLIEKPRIGEAEYNRIVQQANQNALPTYEIFHHNDEEKLRVFYYRNHASNE